MISLDLFYCCASKFLDWISNLENFNLYYILTKVFRAMNFSLISALVNFSLISALVVFHSSPMGCYY